MKTMAELKTGEWGVILEHPCERLKRLGFTAGTKVQCVQKSPMGNPTAYRVRGTIFAIRKEDAFRMVLMEEGEMESWD